MDSGYYERYILSNDNNLLAIQRAKQETHHLFMDSYVCYFSVILMLLKFEVTEV